MIELEKDGITYVIGCLFDAADKQNVDVIAHQANCFKIMGSGFAAALRLRHPAAESIDLIDRRQPSERLGHFTNVRVAGGTMVFNLYGQYRPGKNTDYTALRCSISAMAEYLKKGKPDARIGLPLIGCGVGGGDWKIVSTILKQELCDFDFCVYVLDQKNIPGI